MRIEEYGFIGDLHTGALVGSNGSMDWLCLPRFDSGACFAALLGRPDNGHWRIAPQCVRRSRQRYRQDTLILETEFEADGGRCMLVDFMPPGDHRHDVVRIVRGLEGRVLLSMDLVIRFDYGQTIPWVRRVDGALEAIAGPSALTLHTDIATHGRGFSTVSEFAVRAGEEHAFVLTWRPSHRTRAQGIDARRALADTERFWREWCAQGTYEGPWLEAVRRSLITLKALTYAPTGGIIAAATTSLPEQLGGVRNWDYRYCWLRDATFTLYALLQAGYTEEAQAWSEWLLRAVAGHPAQLQMLYGPAGERSLPEREIKGLDGYEHSRPVRVGNGASDQFQLDVYGEIVDALHFQRKAGLKVSEDSWHLQRALVRFVAEHWQEPDEGVWEVRGGRRHFTHSRVMAWVAVDRVIRSAEKCGYHGDLDHWRALRLRIHEEVCARGYHPGRRAFTQAFGSDRLDASQLLMPLVGFLPIDDPRMQSTVEAIRRELTIGGLVHRYSPGHSQEVDGLPPGEGAFLPCSFWMVDCLYLLGKHDEARDFFEHLLTLRTPLGLLSEEFDTNAGRLVGNFPQAFSHVALVNSAQNLSANVSPADERSQGVSQRSRRAEVLP